MMNDERLSAVFELRLHPRREEQVEQVAEPVEADELDEVEEPSCIASWGARAAARR